MQVLKQSKTSLLYHYNVVKNMYIPNPLDLKTDTQICKQMLSFSPGTTFMVALLAVYVLPTQRKGTVSALYCA